MLAPPPGFSQPTASFFGHCRLGIHLVPFVAFVCFRTAILPRIPLQLLRCGAPAPRASSSWKRHPVSHQPPDTQRPGIRRVESPACLLLRSGSSCLAVGPQCLCALLGLGQGWIVYAPGAPLSNGPSWTRTRDLSLIRGVLSPTELTAPTVTAEE